ncbi:hypothetical protein B0T17DRAFT_496893 [Bombardia bombarda]|uniref:Uncharacterized protein n=1 Tax=Bombardia bombarda TaxID=252184 RepID=A0AA39WID3_9PEZI|nr:hypothetical protein B0T17DRAFT_496893 [Bombardia bombarda]
MLGDLSQQLAANTRRYSRGSGGQRVGNAMRITKPSSANNSPRSSMMQSRRKTLIGESLQSRFHPQAIDPTYLPTPASEMPSESMYEREARPARPVSWHPSSHNFAYPQAYQQQINMLYPYSPYSETEGFPTYQQLPPTPAAYSGYSSPSGFSPSSLPYSTIDAPPFYPPTTQAFSTQASIYQPTTHSNYVSASTVSTIPYQTAPNVVGGALDWKSFATYDNFDTAPPTPEDLQQFQQPGTKLATEDSIPYQPLEDDESDGEILYGMGLYDAPDKSADDSRLDLHRSTIFSLLGGGGAYPEPTGKGLKLEDAWEPPASDDEDGSNDSDEDGEGDEQDD